MAVTIKHSLGKSERLKSRKQIDRLFAAKSFVTTAPIRLFFQFEFHQNDIDMGAGSQVSAIKAGFGCSKKFFKQATKRNRVKRLIREAYRKQKAPLLAFCNQHSIGLNLFWLYGHKQLPSYIEVEKKVDKLLAEVAKKLGKALKDRENSSFL